MNIKHVRYVSFVIVLLMLVVLPAGAASWTDKITGGGQAMAGTIPFSITVSAWEDVNGNPGGQIQYYRPGLVFHGTVACTGVFADGTQAVAAGPGWMQDGTTWLNEGEWIIINIKEGGIGSGDSVRVYKSSPAVAIQSCENGPVGGFPGVLYDGNFNIRQK